MTPAFVGGFVDGFVGGDGGGVGGDRKGIRDPLSESKAGIHQLGVHMDRQRQG